MYKKGLLSVCCLGYKHAAFTRDCIQSIWDNDYKNVEIIACDDGSGDGTIEILKELQAQSPCPFEIIEQENTANIGMNFNRCAARAQGEFITYIALDDIFLPDAFSTKLNLMQQDEKIAFIFSSVVKMQNRDGSFSCRKEENNRQMTIDELYELEYISGTFAIQGNIFRREMVDIVKGFDEDMLGDDIILRTKIIQYMYKKREWTFKRIPDPAVIYRQHSDNISLNGTRQVRNHLQCYDRYWADREYPPFLVELTAFYLYHYSYKEFFNAVKDHPRMIKLLAENDDLAHCLRCNMDKNLTPKSVLYNVAHVEKSSLYRSRLFIFNLLKLSTNKATKHK